MTIMCDALLEGIDFWYYGTKLAFHIPVPSNLPMTSKIFFWEATCVLAALKHFCKSFVASGSLTLYCHKLAIFTNNTNTVDIYNSLATLLKYNSILKDSVNLIITHNIDLWVPHIDGVKNSIANALSQHNFDLAKHLVPGLSIQILQPPWTTLGAAKKMTHQLPVSRQPVRPRWTDNNFKREIHIALTAAINLPIEGLYGSALNSWIVFCNCHKILSKPTLHSLKNYTIYMCNHIKPRSVNTYLSGICNQLEKTYP